MTLKLQHPFTLIVAGPNSCGKSTFVIRLIGCREQLCDVVYDNIVWCHSENNAPQHLKNVSFVKGVPDFENPENVPTLIVLDDLMDSAYSTKVSELFTEGSHHRNISLVLITQNLFNQISSSRDISLNNNMQLCLRTPETRLRLYIQLAKSILKTLLVSTKRTWTHTYLFLDLTQSINDLLRFRTKIFPGELTQVFAPVQGNEPIGVTTTLSSRP